MRILSQTEYEQQAKSIFRRVFIENELYEQPFSSSITERVIVFPCEILPDPYLVNALFAGATKVNDVGCFFSQLWRSSEEPNDCYIPLKELCEICGGLPSTYNLDNKNLDLELHMNLICENAFYSATGKWGLMRSHEGFSVLGGSPSFMNAVIVVRSLIW